MNFDWNKFNADIESEVLEKSKSGSISFIKDQDRLINWEIYHAHWETYLTSDYWKNWREKINSFGTQEEVNFYTDRLRAIMEFIQDHTRKNIRYVENAKPWDPINSPKLIEQELKRLENISEEEFRKTDKWSNSAEVRELTNQEISDMLEYTPNKAGNPQNIFEKNHDDNQNQSEQGQGCSAVNQNDNKCMSAVRIFAIIGVVGAIIIASVVVKKSLRKPKK